MQLENKNPINLFRDDQSRAYIQNFLFQQQRLILQDKLEKGDIKFSEPTNDISVKGTSNFVYLDGANETKHFTDYQFLKRTKSEVAKPAADSTLKKNLKKRIDAANLQTEADLKILGDKVINSDKQVFKKQRTVNLKTGAVSTKVQKIATPSPSTQKKVVKPLSKSASKPSIKTEVQQKKFAKIVAKLSSAKETKKTKSAVSTGKKELKSA